MFRKIRTLKWLEVWKLVKQTFVEFFQENAFFHGAALAYYTIFALVPIIYLSIVSFGRIIGQETMIDIIASVLRKQIGIDDVSGIIDFLKEVDFEKGSFVLHIVGIIALLFSSTALLASLKNSINDFFDLEVKHATRRKALLSNLMSKAISVGLLAFFGLIVIVVYFAQTLLISFGNELFKEANTLQWFLLIVIQHGLAILTNLLIFVCIFKYLHDAYVPWKLAWAGSAVTSFLLYFGQLLIKFYLVNYFFARDGGIAGTLLVILAWMYYSSQIIFLGAKFTAVYARKVGIPIVQRK